MSGFYKKAVVWLGLNEDYPEEFEAPQEAAGRPSPRLDQLDGSSARPAPGGQRPEGAQQMPRQQPQPAAAPQRPPQQRAQPSESPLTAKSVHDPQEGAVRAVPMEDEPARPSTNIIGTVRPLAAPKTVKPKVVIPQSFNDAQLVADTFREPKPVIVNMQNAERDLARRLIDFSSGLCYGLGGQMEKVARDVYLLTPDDVEVADEDRENY